jgi:hypothetical protein
VKRLILIAALYISSSAFAALGDHENVVNSDAIKLKSSRHSVVQTNSLYSVHELETPIAKIQEFVDNSGQVFAVSWRGIRRPDLSVLLGSFYGEYNNIDSRRARMITRAPVSIQTSRIVVRKGGHMRDIKGMAVISDQLPAGVRLEDLQ